MSDTVEFEIGDDTYEVEASEFSPPGPYRWNEPPDGGEITLDDTVLLVHGSTGPYSERPKERIPMEKFLQVYAEERGILPEKALPELEDRVFEILCQRYDDDFDDRDI